MKIKSYRLESITDKYVAENKDAFGTDHIIVEEELCL